MTSLLSVCQVSGPLGPFRFVIPLPWFFSTRTTGPTTSRVFWYFHAVHREHTSRSATVSSKTSSYSSRWFSFSFGQEARTDQTHRGPPPGSVYDRSSSSAVGAQGQPEVRRHGFFTHYVVSSSSAAPRSSVLFFSNCACVSGDPNICAEGYVGYVRLGAGPRWGRGVSGCYDSVEFVFT